VTNDLPANSGLGRVTVAAVCVFLLAIVAGVMVFAGPFIRHEMNATGPSESDAGYATLIYLLGVWLPVSIFFFLFIRQHQHGTYNTWLANLYVALALGWCLLTGVGIGYLVLYKEYPRPH
jgi:drug/metabolite transporter (DMT)-like permease